MAGWIWRHSQAKRRKQPHFFFFFAREKNAVCLFYSLTEGICLRYFSDLCQVLSDCSRPSHTPNRLYFVVWLANVESLKKSVGLRGHLGRWFCCAVIPAVLLPLNPCSEKGPQEVSGPVSFSKLDQDWIHTKFLGALSSQILKISKDEECTASLGNLLQWLDIFTMEITSFHLIRTSPRFNSSLLHIVLSPCTMVVTRLCVLANPVLGMGRLLSCPLKPMSSPGWAGPSPSAPPHKASAPDPTSLRAFCWTCSSLSMSFLGGGGGLKLDAVFRCTLKSVE